MLSQISGCQQVLRSMNDVLLYTGTFSSVFYLPCVLGGGVLTYRHVVFAKTATYFRNFALHKVKHEFARHKSVSCFFRLKFSLGENELDSILPLTDMDLIL